MCHPPHEEVSLFYVCTLDKTEIDKTVTTTFKKCYIFAYAIMFVLTFPAKIKIKKKKEKKKESK